MMYKHIILSDENSKGDVMILKNMLSIFLVLIVVGLLVSCESSSKANGSPPKPQFPENFKWEGRWIVDDLDVDVSFSWHGSNGDLQMIAGGEDEKIHFTNLIYNDHLYTFTLKWPGVVPPTADDNCVCLGKLPLEVLNGCLAYSRYVGAEILLEEEERYVEHFRISVVLGDSESKPDAFRLPIMEGDFYVDQEDSTRMWKVLHYGLQNALDPALDEWAVMESIEDTPGEINFPAECEEVRAECETKGSVFENEEVIFCR
jgi:hypothetical protein